MIIIMGSSNSQAAQLLETRGLRPTDARRYILELLLETHQHYTPEELSEALRSRGRPLSIATLYQNLNKLAEKGLLVRFKGPDGVLRFDANVAPHHHLVCIECGAMVDVKVIGPLARISPKPVTRGEALEMDSWSIQEKHIEFRGLCPACQAKQTRNQLAAKGPKGSAGRP